MSDAGTTPQGGAGTQTETQGGAGAGSKDSNGATGPDGKPWDPDRAMETIRAQRAEIDDLKTRSAKVSDLEKRVAEFEKERLSETEKLTRERDEALARAEKAEGSLSDRDLAAVLEAAAAEAGAKAGRAGTVARLVDRSAITKDADGKPTNLPALLDAVRKEAPDLFEERRPSGSAEGGARTPASTETMSDRIRKGFGRRA